MRSVLCGFALGVVGLQQCAVLPSRAAVLLYFLGACAAALGAGTFFYKRAIACRSMLAYARIGVGVLSAMILGFSWAGWRAHERLAFYLPPHLEQRTLLIEGEVASVPTMDPHSSCFLFDITPPSERISSADLFSKPLPPSFPRRIQLSWYARPGQILPMLHIGEHWRLKVKLTRIHGQSNPYGTDFEALMLEQNVRASGYVLNQAASVFLGKGQQAQAARQRSVYPFLSKIHKKWFDGIAQWRQTLYERLNQVLGDAAHKGVITALAIGLQTDISAQDKQTFTRTGTNHLVAISGLHIALAAGFIGNLSAFIWRRLAYFGFRGPIWVAAPKVAALIGAAVGLLYAALSGFGVPAQRAAIMLCVLSAATLGGREIAASLKLAWALAVVLFIDPWAVVSAGFWLSFGAVAIILLSMRPRAGEDIVPGSMASGPALAGCSRWLVYRRAATEMMHLQVCITLGLIPFTALWFNQVSWVGPLANVVAIPWVSFGVVPPVLAGVILPAPLDAWALCAAQTSFAWLSFILETFSAASWALKPVPAPGMMSLISAGVGLSLWIGWPTRACHRFAQKLPGGRIACMIMALGLFIPLAFSFEARPAVGEFRVTALDVGQGAAALIETAQHRLLFDAGPSYHSSWIEKTSRRAEKTIGQGTNPSASSPLQAPDAGQRIVLPYLQARGIDRLDGLVISHADTDHSGGAHSVLLALPIKWFRASLPKQHALWSIAKENQRRSVLQCKSRFSVWVRDRWCTFFAWFDLRTQDSKKLDKDLRKTIESPLSIPAIALCRAGERWVWDGVIFTFLWPDNPKLRGTRNAGSCVLRVENKRYAALLAADIEAAQERALVIKQREALRADLLLAPHHGSRTSSSNAFLQAVGAHDVIFQMGYLNRFGHPHPIVVRRYQRYGVEQHRSDWHGALIWESELKKVERHRSRRARYWFTSH